MSPTVIQYIYYIYMYIVKCTANYKLTNHHTPWLLHSEESLGRNQRAINMFKHQRVFVISKTTSNIHVIRHLMSSTALLYHTLFSDFPDIKMQLLFTRNPTSIILYVLVISMCIGVLFI